MALIGDAVAPQEELCLRRSWTDQLAAGSEPGHPCGFDAGHSILLCMLVLTCGLLGVSQTRAIRPPCQISQARRSRGFLSSGRWHKREGMTEASLLTRLVDPRRPPAARSAKATPGKAARRRHTTFSKAGLGKTTGCILFCGSLCLCLRPRHGGPEPCFGSGALDIKSPPNPCPNAAFQVWLPSRNTDRRLLLCSGVG